MRRIVTILAITVVFLGICILVFLVFFKLQTQKPTTSSSSQNTTSSKDFAFGSKIVSPGDVYPYDTNTPPSGFTTVAILRDVSQQNNKVYTTLQFVSNTKPIKVLAWYPRGLMVLSKQSTTDINPKPQSVQNKSYTTNNPTADLRKYVGRNVLVGVSLLKPSIPKNHANLDIFTILQEISDINTPCNIKLFVSLQSHDPTDLSNCIPYIHIYSVYENQL